jgi:NADH:ubiquinone oxidoreductase subunit 2 (subunit N)
VKLGLFPFDYWVPGVFKSCSYFGCFLVGVVQKLIPLYLLRGLGLSRGLEVVMIFISLITALKGCVIGLGIKDVRFLLGYSSLVHLG